jgi:hypothetical protein
MTQPDICGPCPPEGRARNPLVASASVRNPRHVTHFYSLRARKILGRTVKFKPGFYWLKIADASRAHCLLEPRKPLKHIHLIFTQPTGFDFSHMATSSRISPQGSTIVVHPYVDSQPTKCCTRCRKDFPETSAHFNVSRKGGLAAMCLDCTAKQSAARRAREQSAQSVVSAETRGRKRKVLTDMDSNVQRKAPKLAPKEPVRWDMRKYTKEQIRSKAARERENRYRRNNSVTPVPTYAPGMDLPAFSSIAFPSRTPPPPTPPSPRREAPISDTDWANINTFHEYLSKQEMETCIRCRERWFQMDLLNGVCGACMRRDRNLQEGEPFLFSKENNMDPGVVPGCLQDLTQMEEMIIAKAHCHMIMKRVRGH